MELINVLVDIVHLMKFQLAINQSMMIDRRTAATSTFATG